METSESAVGSVLVVEGGAMRSVFSAGLLDGFHDAGFRPFDQHIGVSGGAVNLAFYAAGEPGAALMLYGDLALRPQFIRYGRFLGGGHLMDLDWLICEAEAVLGQSLGDVLGDEVNLLIGVTNVGSGKTEYHRANRRNITELLHASTALPLLYRDFPNVGGVPMTDGGVGDAIPVAEALRRGARRIMVVRSRPASYVKKDTLMHRYIRWHHRRHPALVATMQDRVARHGKTVRTLASPPPDVAIVDVCPPEDLTMGRFTKNRRRIAHVYERGRAMAVDAMDRWRSI